MFIVESATSEKSEWHQEGGTFASRREAETYIREERASPYAKRYYRVEPLARREFMFSDMAER